MSHAREDVEAVCIGEHDVEEDGVGRLPLARGAELRVVAQALGLDPRLRQRVDGEVAQVVVVLDVVDHSYAISPMDLPRYSPVALKTAQSAMPWAWSPMRS